MEEMTVSVMTMGIGLLAFFFLMLCVFYFMLRIKHLERANAHSLNLLNQWTVKYDRLKRGFETLDEYIKECEERRELPVLSPKIIRIIKTYEQEARK